ncbi:MAG: betaine/proline/choline family ABC transporter ATP-binding protein [Pseudomonadota bacterium]
MDVQANSEPVIKLEGVWKIFGEKSHEAMSAIEHEGLDKTEVLDRFGCVVGIADVSFTVGRGEVFCIMGLSGSGKSTLVRHLNRLIEPTAGSISVLDNDVSTMGEAQLRAFRAKDIGMVFQHMALMPHRSVRDNVAFPLEVRGEPKFRRWEVSQQALSLVNLDGFEDRLPKELSGGMQQRVGLARALASDPAVLLMDEPFSALDPLIRRQLQHQFLELTKTLHKTTVFITHDLDEAIRIGDRIAIMKDGRIVQIGTPEEIVINPADDYVADFVQDISKLKLVFAHSVMEEIDSYSPSPDEDLSQAPRAKENEDLDHLIDVSITTELPIIITDQAGNDIGVVTKSRLLQGIQGGK